MSHTVPTRVYYTIFAALIILTATTVAVAFMDLGFLNNVVAIAIASAKASLVILYFMHVKYSQKLTWVAIIAGVIFLGILLTITMSDYMTRGWYATAQPW